MRHDQTDDDLPDAFRAVREAIAQRCGEPVLAGVFVHRAPKTGSNGLKRLFGTKDPASRLNTNNHLSLTPTHLRIDALGGRKGVALKEEVGAWPLGQVQLDAIEVDRASWFASVGSHYEYRAYQLRITAPGVDLLVDVMADTELMDVAGNLDAILRATRSGPYSSSRSSNQPSP